MDKETLVEELRLEPVLDGVYLRQTYVSPSSTTISTGEDGSPVERSTMTSIYCMLTTEYPLCFLKNRSDTIHYFHFGLPIKFTMISPEGKVSRTILGQEVLAGQKLQLLVPGGYWKAAEIINTTTSAGYGLFSEAVTPGFDYSDMSVATKEDIEKCLPQEWKNYEHYIKK